MKSAYVAAAAVSALASTLSALPAHAGIEDASTSFTRRLAPEGASVPTHRNPAATTDSAATSGAAVTYRIFGDTRINTAIAASQDRWPDAGQENAAKAVVLSRSNDYADALGGSALAGAAEAPLLLTPTGALHADVEAEIVRVLSPGGTVYVLGGESALVEFVHRRLGELGYQVVRLQGADRYATSVEIAKQTAALAPGGVPQFVFATTGLNFPDGLAAGATAGGYSASVVLTRDSALPGTVKTYLDQMVAGQIPVLAVGGPAARADFPWWGAAVGNDRFQTAQILAEAFWGDPGITDDNPAIIGLSTGLNWPDALAGGAYVAGGGPLLLSRTDSLPDSTKTAIRDIVAAGGDAPVQAGVLFGGPVALTDDVLAEFDAILNPTP
ncbi:cell wall-binding repeat-containing protein [Intrasporangium calvum]|nr:cell wall-binding repeat-containing protein [Intrasporangium calvum]